MNLNRYLFLILGLLAFINYLPHFFKNNGKIDISQFENDIKTFERFQDSVELNRRRGSKRDSTADVPEVRYRAAMTLPLIEINTADSVSLDRLPGIGPVYAKRILKYRELLGGFLTLDQLNEVYGLKPEIVLKFRKFLMLDTTRLHKINLKLASFKKVNAHPYISFEQTKAIFKLRDHQKLNTLTDLQKSGIFDSLQWRKIKPYLVWMD